MKAAKNVLTSYMGSEKYILIDFAKHLSFSELQKNSKVANV